METSSVHNRFVMVLRLRAVLAVLVAIAGAVVALAQLHLPSEPFWDALVPVQWVSVGLLAFFVFDDAWRSVGQAIQARSIREFDNTLRAALSLLMSEIIEATGVPWDEVAVHYYRRRRKWLRRRLIPVAAIKAGADDIDAGGAVRPGEGVAGSAFDDQELHAVEWREFLDAALAEGRAAWDQRSREDRYGLRWGQMRLSTPYEGVVANPTWMLNGDPNGCVVVKGPFTMSALTSAKVRETLDRFSRTLERIGSPPRGWWAVNG